LIVAQLSSNSVTRLPLLQGSSEPTAMSLRRTSGIFRPSCGISTGNWRQRDTLRDQQSWSRL